MTNTVIAVVADDATEYTVAVAGATEADAIVAACTKLFAETGVTVATVRKVVPYTAETAVGYGVIV